VFPHTRVKGPSLYYFRKINGKVVEIRIGRLDEGETILRQRYRELVAPTPRTVGDLLMVWMEVTHNLRPRTEAEYRRQIESELNPVLGRMPLRALTRSVIGQYLERRGNVSANREVACLSTVCEWGIRRGWMEENPCRGVRRNRETPRNRYITNRELGQALRKTTPEFRDFMLAAYFTGFRQGDLRSLRRDQVHRLIQVEEGKGRKRVRMAYSAALQALIARCLKRHTSDYVFTDTRGERWGEWAIQSAMRRLQVDWTFHDLRAKAESDHPTGLGLLTRYKRARELKPTR
jgi:site-specific recombinase XerC